MRHVHNDHLIVGPNGKDSVDETLGEDVDVLPVERQEDNQIMKPDHVGINNGPPPH